MNWLGVPVAVTGGCSFIGSHLVDRLLELGAQVRVIDDLSSGTHLPPQGVTLEKTDLAHLHREEVRSLFKDTDYVFHLAYVHGGRGFITMHPAEVCKSLAIDANVFEAANQSKVANVVYASTACVYDPNLQASADAKPMKEDDADISEMDEYHSADIEYGYCKLIGGEMQMIAYNKQYGQKGVPLRFVTAYGPRENESHAIIALIYKSLRRQEPFEIWGDGMQQRDFTYVRDLVEAMVLAAYKADNPAKPINVGTGRKYTINETCCLIWKMLGWKPKTVRYLDKMPVGAYSRALDIRRAKEMLGWSPRYSLYDGLMETIPLYQDNGRWRQEQEIDLFARK